MARKPAEVRRKDLVEAGLRVIAREGMHAATVRAIVAEADVPLATFHYVFESRDEMIGEAYAYVVLPRVGELPIPFGTDSAPLEAVRAVLHDWIDRFVAHPE
ncbi:TetR family transcriptional regulator [Agrococcus sp. ARC_14]|uniref:TetR/AcrR family transcriptional regulator n=1 Tax=Agrococcus sp. ARC_14 TaxID=2919927 RepID=UPI001F05E2C9|nr:TetR family transcriptional regulator [Agrococcus sp. ARC_14]